MDKESLAILIKNLSEPELVDIYKIKKINNFGFRANTVEDIRKNRVLLESNLLKPINLKIVQKYLVSVVDNLNIDEVITENIKEMIEKHGKLKIASTLCVHGKIDELERMFSEISSCVNEEIHSPAIEMNNEEKYSDIKTNKVIKKLEIKIANLMDELIKKDEQYKMQIEDKNNLLSEVRKEKDNLKRDLANTFKEKESFEQENLLLSKELEKLKIESEKLLKLNEKIKGENKILEVEILNLNENIEKQTIEIYSENDSSDNVFTRDYSIRIAVVGESNKNILKELPEINFTFYNSRKMNELVMNKDIFNEIWIIHYDLTQKEKRLIQSFNIEELGILEIKNISNLKELNQIIANLKI